MKKPVLIRFGRRIRELRKERGLSQEQFAEKSGLHRNYIGMVERGERNPSLVNIDIFADSLDISLHEIFNDSVFNIGSNSEQEE